MPRYFIEVAYDGKNYSGFQVQKNANTIQAEVSRALEIFYKNRFELTGSSRTDAGVHARQNFFHFDIPFELDEADKNVYNINAILPGDIAVKRLFRVPDDAHSRFDAVSRVYHYYIYQRKDPFLRDTAFFYPFRLDIGRLNAAASTLMNYDDFTSFSKRSTQVKTFKCRIFRSNWELKEGVFIYTVEANRFLRGMVKGLVGTMLRVGRGIIDVNEFEEIIEARNCARADFSVSSAGLFLSEVKFSDTYNNKQ